MVTSQSKTSPRLSRSLFWARIDHAQKKEENTRDETPFVPNPELLAVASRYGIRSTPSLLVQPKCASWVRSLSAAVMTSSRLISKFASPQGFPTNINCVLKAGEHASFFLDALTLSKQEQRTSRARLDRLTPLGGKLNPRYDGSIQAWCAPRCSGSPFSCSQAKKDTMTSTEDDSLVPGKRYGSVMSTPNINQLIDHRVDSAQHAKFNRSSSVGPGVTASSLNPQQRNRRALYVNLPFFRCAKIGEGRIQSWTNVIGAPTAKQLMKSWQGDHE